MESSADALRGPLRLMTTANTDPQLLQFFETGKGYEELHEVGRALVDLVAEHAEDGVVPEVSEQWHPPMWQDETVPTLVVDVPEGVAVPAVLRYLTFDPSRGEG